MTMRQKRIARDKWFLELAEVIAKRSEDPYVKVGAIVIRDDYTVIGVGYNGAPAGVDLDAATWADRDARRPFMIHAEMNAIRYARPREVWGVYTTHIPCEHCMSVLGSYGTSVVVYTHSLGEAYDETLIRRIANINSITLRQERM
jgi:dCMP deaminase